MAHKTKYIYGLLFGLLFICSLYLNTVTASAAPLLSASADKINVVQGDYVSINISMKNNPQISTLGMLLNYDDSILQYDSSMWSSSFTDSDMTMASDTGDSVNLSVVCDGSYSADGTIVTVRFLASQNASSIPARLVLRDMTDVDLAAVSDCSVASTIKIPETVNVKAEIEENNSNGEDLGASMADVSKEAVAQQEVRTSNGSVSNGQHTSTKSVLSTSSASAADCSKVDENYKTGAGVGRDVFLFAAVICGIIALVMAAKREGESK